jgi:hypothetical protein
VFGIVSCALHISYRDITTSNTTNQGADEHVSHVNEITHVMTLKWFKAKYRQRLKQSKENPKHVKDLYYHLSHYVFDGVRNVKECKYIVQCLAGYKENHESHPPRPSSSDDAAVDDENNDRRQNNEVMNVDGMVSEELEEYKFWNEIDDTIEHYYIDDNNTSPKYSNIEALMKFEEILKRIDTGVNNWARMKNYFNESHNIQALSLSDSQWKRCIEKFTNKNDMSKYATMLNNKHSHAAVNKEVQSNEWQTQRLTIQRRLVVKTCDNCGSRYKRSHVKCLSATEQRITRNCSNESCCSRCSINDDKCVSCIMNDQAAAASKATNNHNISSTVNVVESSNSTKNSRTESQPLEAYADIIMSMHERDININVGDNQRSHMSTNDVNGGVIVKTCNKCTVRYLHQHKQCLTASYQHKSKNCLNKNCLNRCKKRSKTGYCKQCQRRKLIQILLNDTSG